MSAFIEVMFWLYLVKVVVRSFYVFTDHPRQEKPASIGADMLSFNVAAIMLAWVAYLKFGA